jgi:NAD-dependent SIR2 family protein deacetylase
MRYDQQAEADEPQCLNCGHKIDPKTARVLGDNNNNVPECAECRDPTSNNQITSNVRAALSGHRRERNE